MTYKSQKSLILGTANFAKPYGARGPKIFGQAEIDDLLGTAIRLGINSLDTASSYNNYRQLRHALVPNIHNWEITSKLALTDFPIEGITKFLEGETLLIKNQLGGLNNILLHNWTPGILDYGALWELSKFMIQNGMSLGASTYGAEDAKAAINSGVFQVIQIEFNVLNQVNKESIVPNGDKKNRTKIIARSVLLQGVLSNSISKLPEKLKRLTPLVDSLKKLANSYELSLEEMAIRFVLSLNGIDGLVVGVDNKAQLIQVHEYFSRGPLCKVLFEELTNYGESNFWEVDPRMW